MLNTHMTKEREVPSWAIGAPAIGVPLMVALLALTAPTHETPVDEADMGIRTEQDVPRAAGVDRHRAAVIGARHTEEWGECNP